MAIRLATSSSTQRHSPGASAAAMALGSQVQDPAEQPKATCLVETFAQDGE